MNFEIEIIEFLQSGRCQFFDVSFQIISALGSTLGVVALCLLFLVKKPKLCFWYLLSYGFVYLTVRILKETVQRVRPFNVTDAIANIGDTVTDFSFPSGHVACATAIAIFLGYFLFQYFKSRGMRVGIVLSCSVYVVLVALSRMYLGKHFLTDVLAGAIISAVICSLGLLLMHFASKKKKVKENENKN